ncbi:MAG: hypothetical protein V3T83_14860, partial [Acidobacteriota bacterium]
MQRKNRSIRIVLLSVLLAACRSGGEPSSTRAAAVVREVAAGAWQRMLDDDPALRLRLGMKVERLPELGLAQAQRNAEQAMAELERLTPLDPDDLE